MLPSLSRGQHFFRIKADFSIKESSPDGKTLLTKGVVYYDINEKKLIYEVSFPEKETWVSIDTVFYRIINNRITETKSAPGLAETSVFHLCLKGQLDNYGFQQSNFKATNVEHENGMDITTWIPPKKYKNTVGKILISQKDKKLFGIAYYNKNEKLTMKEIYKQYTQVSGLDFPTNIVQIEYDKSGETYRIQEYKNIVVNEPNTNTPYKYRLPIR